MPAAARTSWAPSSRQHLPIREGSQLTDFTKYQALGNDYLLIDPLRVECQPSAGLARALCDRHFGVGADGVLFGPAESPADGTARVTIFNSDGSACERSANGIRMFALYLADHYSMPTELTVETSAGDSAVQICDAAAGLVRIGLGKPSFDPRDIPVTGATEAALRWPLNVGTEVISVTSVSNGNPHAVVIEDSLDHDRTRELGPLIAGHSRFPSRCNVEFVKITDRHTIEAQIWERGAGETLASGSGGCAAAAAAHALGLVDDQVAVRMAGGIVTVVVDSSGSLWLTGVVEQVARGDLAPVLRKRLGIRPLTIPSTPVVRTFRKATR